MPTISLLRIRIKTGMVSGFLKDLQGKTKGRQEKKIREQPSTKIFPSGRSAFLNDPPVTVRSGE